MFSTGIPSVFSSFGYSPSSTHLPSKLQLSAQAATASVSASSGPPFRSCQIGTDFDLPQRIPLPLVFLHRGILPVFAVMCIQQDGLFFVSRNPYTSYPISSVKIAVQIPLIDTQINTLIKKTIIRRPKSLAPSLKICFIRFILLRLPTFCGLSAAALCLHRRGTECKKILCRAFLLIPRKTVRAAGFRDRLTQRAFRMPKSFKNR